MSLAQCLKFAVVAYSKKLYAFNSLVFGQSPHAKQTFSTPEKISGSFFAGCFLPAFLLRRAVLLWAVNLRLGAHLSLA
jgi:hypothetical protein